MGYETRITVILPYTETPGFPNSGEFIASIELGKCGNGPVGTAIQKAIQNGRKNPLTLWPLNPDRQQEAVEFLRNLTEKYNDAENDECFIEKLADDIEDGYVTKDKYDDPLGVADLDEFIAALKEELKIDDWHSYKIALALLESIKNEYSKSKLKVITYGH